MSISRRAFLTAGATGALAAALVSSPPARGQNGPARRPIVLVHGAWHGGWCWKRVTPLLRAAGHEVFTPTLTGLGERVHLAGTSIDLATHITDVLNVLKTEELANVVLVGHSYGGMVITGVADQATDKLHSLVYLDAFVPKDGKSLLDYVPPERRAAGGKAAEASGYVEPLPADAFGITRPADQEWVTRRLTRQPFATFSQPLRLERGDTRFPRTYVYCTSPAMGLFDQFAKEIRDDPTWRFHELKTGHDCMITDPDAVARIVLELLAK
jgi:pimeloyl-ACP methyl ester carboxylesterase